MILGIKVSGFDEVEKLSLMEEKRGLVEVSNLIFNKVVNGERDNVLMRLMGKFKSLRFEDLEEIYDDGCLVLWDRMMDKDFKLREKNMVGYLVRVCKNIGMHYLRKVNEGSDYNVANSSLSVYYILFGDFRRVQKAVALFTIF